MIYENNDGICNSRSEKQGEDENLKKQPITLLPPIQERQMSDSATENGSRQDPCLVSL
jgi:hypothetical protein